MQARTLIRVPKIGIKVFTQYGKRLRNGGKNMSAKRGHFECFEVIFMFACLAEQNARATMAISVDLPLI